MTGISRLSSGARISHENMTDMWNRMGVPGSYYAISQKTKFFVFECKFRSSLFEGKLQWSNPQQLKRYQEFAKEKRLPFFVVIGSGMKPYYPERMFCIPLEEAKYPALFPSIFERFERKPDKPFFWKNEVLK